MRAVVFEQFGDPASVLQLRDVPQPQPGQGEILVRMLASPVNPSDLLTVRGQYSKLPTLPAVPGYEGVGVVEAAGGGLLPRLMVGKRVAVMNRATGNWCERTVIPATQAIPLAKDLPLAQAAMFFVNPATAYVLTRDVLRVPRGAWLLQTAAGSAVGRMVVRLGRHFGFRTLNVVRRAEQEGELESLGADAVVSFDPARDEPRVLHEAVKRIVGEDGIRHALDCVAGATGSAVVGTLGRGGRLAVFGTMTNEPLAFSSRALMIPGAQVEGFWLANHMAGLGIPSKLRLVRRLTGLIRAGVLSSEVEATYPLDRVVEAVRRADEPGRGGKVLLVME